MRIASAFITALLIASSALADWEGTMHIKMPTGGNSPIEMTGTVRAKKHLQRTDLKTLSGMESSSIVDMKKEKVWSLIHAQKMAMEMATELAESKTPACSTEDVEGCLTKQGFKKVGEEAANGHPCTIYENTQTDKGQKTTTRLWRPNDLKEVAAVKWVVQTSKGDVTGNIMDIKTVAQADSHFEVPSDYRTMNMGKLGDMFKGMKKPDK